MRRLLTLLLTGGLTAPSVTLGASGPLARALGEESARLVTVASHASDPTASGAVELRWAELASVIVGRRVTVVLSDGGRLTGDAVVVRDDALVVDVKRSTGTRAYPGGNAPIARTSIAFLEMEKSGGAGRPLGTVLGVLAGVVIGGWIAGEVADSAGVGIPTFLGVASGFTLAGFYAGKQVSREVTVIRIVDVDVSN